MEDFGRNGFGKTDDLEDLPFFSHKNNSFAKFRAASIGTQLLFKFISSTLLGRLQTQVDPGLSNESINEKEIDSGFRPFKT